jgi:hypothetical protein
MKSKLTVFLLATATAGALASRGTQRHKILG